MSLPNKIKLNKQKWIKMNVDLCLMRCLFGESKNDRFELEEGKNKEILLSYVACALRIEYILF